MFSRRTSGRRSSSASGGGSPVRWWRPIRRSTSGLHAQCSMICDGASTKSSLDPVGGGRCSSARAEAELQDVPELVEEVPTSSNWRRAVPSAARGWKFRTSWITAGRRGAPGSLTGSSRRLPAARPLAVAGEEVEVDVGQELPIRRRGARRRAPPGARPAPRGRPGSPRRKPRRGSPTRHRARSRAGSRPGARRRQRRPPGAGARGSRASPRPGAGRRGRRSGRARRRAALLRGKP